MNDSMRNLKDKIVLCSWTIGLLILLSLFWILTQNIQSRYLLRAINNVFIHYDYPYRVSSPLTENQKKHGIMCFRYNIYNSQDILTVFTVFQEGILTPLGAIVSVDGSVKEIIPLTVHAHSSFNKLSSQILQMYIRQIESEGDK